MNNLVQISNKVFCEPSLLTMDIKTKRLPNPYYDVPYLYIEDFFSISLCHKIIARIQKESDFKKARLRSSSLALKEMLDQTIRKTNIYTLNEFESHAYIEQFKNFQSRIEEYFTLSLTTASKTQLLEYQKGSFYKAHSDDSNMIIDKHQNIIGFDCVAANRKLTSVLFLNGKEEDKTNGFQGGELKFNYLYTQDKQPITLQPKAGAMLLFLSNPYFTHEVLPVTEGLRYTLVQWHDALI